MNEPSRSEGQSDITSAPRKPGDQLLLFRQAAAIASGGVSDSYIYAALSANMATKSLSGTVLDYGAGGGAFAKALWRSGRFARIQAIDMLPRPADLPPDIVWQTWDLNLPTAFPPQSFDVIVAAEVIEHLENPRAVAREWYRLLKTGGYVFFSTPNSLSLRSLASLLIRGHFVAFGDSSYPAHITALLRLDIERVVEEAGFSRPQFSYSDVGAIPGFPQYTWQSVLGRITRGALFSDNLICYCRRDG